MILPSNILRVAVHLGCLLGLAIVGCSGQPSAGGDKGLEAMIPPASALPQRVWLVADGGESGKMPWMNANPFLTRDRKVLAESEADCNAPAGSATELLIAVYRNHETTNAIAEIRLQVVSFSDSRTASRAAQRMAQKGQDSPGTTAESAPTVLCRQRIVCILSQTPGVGQQAWAAMVQLVENMLARMPEDP